MIAVVTVLAHFIRKMINKYTNEAEKLNSSSIRGTTTHDDNPPMERFSVVSSSDGTVINTTTAVKTNLQTTIAIKNNNTHRVIDENRQPEVFNDNLAVVVVDIENGDPDTRKYNPF